MVLTDTLPAGATFVSLTQTAGSDAFTATQSGGTVTVTAGAAIAAGNSDTFSLVVNAPAGLAAGANFSDTASVTGGTSDPNTANNSATVTGSVVSTYADLAVTNTGPTSAPEGNNLTFTVVVTNKGPAAATGVVLTNTLGANLRYVSASTTQGTISHSGGVVTFTVGTINPGYAVTIRVTGQALEEGTLTDAASVGSGAPDPNAANNSATAATTVTEPAISVTAPIVTASTQLINAAVAVFTHANGVEPAGDFTATISWGDGTSSPGTISPSGTSYRVIGSHTYKTSGSHTISATVTEVSAATQLLLAKIGDEVPGLPDHVQIGHGNGTPGGATGHDLAAGLAALVPDAATGAGASDLEPLLAGLRRQAAADPRAQALLLALDDLFGGLPG